MINMIEWRKQIIAQKDVVALPIMTHPGIEEQGHTVREAITSGEIHASAVKYLADRYPTAAASVIMDLTVEAEAFGADIIFPEDEIASVNGALLKTTADIDNLVVPSLNEGRIKEYLKANVIAHNEIKDRPLFAGCIGPFSLAGRLFDMSEIMMLVLSNPDSAHKLLDKCTTFILKYCRALKKTGANGVVMAEPAAGLMSNDDCQKFSSEYVKRIIDDVQDENFMVVLHNCGNTGHCTEAMVSTGAHALHLGNKCDLVEIAEQTPSDVLVMGNLDPVTVFKQSTPEEMYSQTIDLLQRTSRFPNVIISSGCDTPPHTPMANVDMFFKAVKDFNASR